jgi:mRNA-decapping enzyme subunit 2
MVAPSKDILDDLCMRFVLNCPEEELKSWERLLFQVEQAHWFYEDHLRPQNTDLKSYSLKEFLKVLFENCSVLKPYKAQLGDIYAEFNAYKSQVPVMGAIILDEGMEHCLLLRGIKNNASWGFPKGKVNQGEADVACAVREVLEETSLDIGSMVSEEDSIEVKVRNQQRKMYIVAGVDRQTLFAPQMRGEVGNYAWMPISSLPSKKEDEGAGVLTEEEGKLKFWEVWRFVKPLKAWVKKTKRKKKQQPQGKKKKTQPVPTPTPTPTPTPVPTSSAAPRADASRSRDKKGAHPFLDFRFDREAIMAKLAMTKA